MSNSQHPAAAPVQLIHPDGSGSCTGECGDRVEMLLELQGEAIARVAFRCDGCAHTVLAANSTAELARNLTLRAALRINALDVLAHQGDVPEDHEHCALLAVNALHEAIADALRTRREPWKKLYRPR